jgi:hypothetical protein
MIGICPRIVKEEGRRRLGVGVQGDIAHSAAPFERILKQRDIAFDLRQQRQIRVSAE